MKAFVFEGPGKASLKEVPKPEFKGEGALVEIKTTSICATDIKIFKNGHFKIKDGEKRILGHEIFAEVLEISEKYKDTVPVGSKVFITPNIGCGRCEYCLMGKTNLCPDYDAFGITIDGSFAEYMFVPERALEQGNLIPLEGDVPDYLVPLAEPLSTCLYNLDNVDMKVGDTVLVIGSGFMGLLNAISAKISGASFVATVDVRDERLEVARDLGMDYQINSSREDLEKVVKRITGGRNFDIVIVTVPLPEVQSISLKLVSRIGKVSFFAGLPSGSGFPSLNTNLVHYQQLTLTGTTGADTVFYRKALRMITHRGDLREMLEKLITTIVSLEQMEEAFLRAVKGEELKVVVRNE